MRRHDNRHTNRRTDQSLKNQEHTWIRQIPDLYPDILRSPAVTFKNERDLPRIKANKYVVFTRPYRGKQGLLIIGKHARPAIIDEESPDKPSICPMRIDRESILDTWIFGISIYKVEGLIQLEDCIVANGEQIRSTKPFNERFGYMERFCNSMWSKDKDFQGTDIQVASFYPLESIQQAISKLNGGCICFMPDSPLNRLLKVSSVIHDASSAPSASSATSVSNAPSASSTTSVSNAPNAPSTTNSEFLCNPVEGKPDVYMLTQNGKDMGRACIQTLSISHALQQRRSSGSIKVLCAWNADFESYTVTQIL